MAKKAKFNKYNVLDTTVSFTYQDYVENCEDIEEEPAPENSAEFLLWCADMRENYYLDDLANLRCSKDMCPCLITGSLGLWWGHPDIEPVLCPDIESAVKKCFGSCDDIRVEFEDGVYTCYAMHHDGTNVFEVRKLSKKGLKATENGLNGKTPKTYWFCKFIGY